MGSVHFEGHPVCCCWARVASGKCWMTQGHEDITGVDLVARFFRLGRPGEEALQLLTSCRLKECGGSLEFPGPRLESLESRGRLCSERPELRSRQVGR